MAHHSRSSLLALAPVCLAVLGCTAPRLRLAAPEPPRELVRAPEPAALHEKAPGDVLLLPHRPLRILIEGQSPILVGPSGVVLIDLTIVGMWSRDGVFTNASGQPLARLSTSGVLRLESERLPPQGRITIDTDGHASVRIDSPPAQTLSFDERGHILGAGREVRVEGLTRETRRIAMLALLAPDLISLGLGG